MKPKQQFPAHNLKEYPFPQHHIVSGCKCSRKSSISVPLTGIVPTIKKPAASSPTNGVPPSREQKLTKPRSRTTLSTDLANGQSSSAPGLSCSHGYSPAWPHPLKQYSWLTSKWLSLVALPLLLLFLPGCSTCGDKFIACSPYKPSNVYRSGPIIPVHIRRVAVLPISATPADWQANELRLELQSVLQSELGKTKSFEQVVVTQEQLREWTGRSSWLPEDKLPPDIFIKITAETGCEAILFARLHPFHGFKPLVAGWEMKLVDVHTTQIIWAVDEVFDAGEPVIAQSAMQWFRNNYQPGLDRHIESDAVLVSPRRFNAYALNSLFSTLPARSLQ